MIGWVKAKGACEKMVQDPKFVKEPKPFGQRCKIRIDLPNAEKLEGGGKGKGVWKVWAWVRLDEFDQKVSRERFFSVTIVKSRHLSLLATDPLSTIRSVKMSDYYFGKDGKVFEASITISLETANGETLLEQQIPLARDSIHKHGEGASDHIILMLNLGIGWEY